MAFPVTKFKNMCKHEFNIEIVTPLFSGVADKIKAELRESALKGVMRFWWRALYGSDDINDMKKKETKIFGNTDHKSDVEILIQSNLKSVKKNITKGRKFLTKSKGKVFPLYIIEYLAYGLYEYKKGNGNVFTHEHFQPTDDFEISLHLSCSSDNENQITNALKTIHMFGGFGARCRNGFGNISIKQFLKEDLENYFKQLANGQKKDFTSFSHEARLFIFKEQNTWDAALSDIGLAYKSGRNNLEKKHIFNRRQLIAKPIIVKGEINISDRHAKPYFLHVHNMENGRYRGQILFLPYNYYKNEKQHEYESTCNDMNNSIKNADNFVKEILAS